MDKNPFKVSISEFRTNLSDILEDSNKAPVIITGHGKPVNVVLSFQEFIAMSGKLKQKSSEAKKEKSIWGKKGEVIFLDDEYSAFDKEAESEWDKEWEEFLKD